MLTAVDVGELARLVHNRRILALPMIARLRRAGRLRGSLVVISHDLAASNEHRQFLVAGVALHTGRATTDLAEGMARWRRHLTLGGAARDRCLLRELEQALGGTLLRQRLVACIQQLHLAGLFGLVHMVGRGYDKILALSLMHGKEVVCVRLDSRMARVHLLLINNVHGR